MKIQYPINNLTNYYLVYHQFAALTASRFCIPSASFFNRSSSSRSHAFCAHSIKWIFVVSLSYMIINSGWSSIIFAFRIFHMFSIGLTSGEYGGQSTTLILISSSHLVTACALSIGSLSCIKILSKSNIVGRYSSRIFDTSSCCYPPFCSRVSLHIHQVCMNTMPERCLNHSCLTFGKVSLNCPCTKCFTYPQTLVIDQYKKGRIAQPNLPLLPYTKSHFHLSHARLSIHLSIASVSKRLENEPFTSVRPELRCLNHFNNLQKNMSLWLFKVATKHEYWNFEITNWLRKFASLWKVLFSAYCVMESIDPPAG